MYALIVSLAVLYVVFLAALLHVLYWTWRGARNSRAELPLASRKIRFNVVLAVICGALTHGAFFWNKSQCFVDGKFGVIGFSYRCAS